jgi:Na+/H+ antiporter NhaD/arsenite permease-like protein
MEARAALRARGDVPLVNVGWYTLLGEDAAKVVTLAVLVGVFALVLYRRFSITLVALAGAVALLALGAATPLFAVREAVSWNVLAIYLGYGLLAFTLERSGLAAWFTLWVLRRIRIERYALLFLCILAAVLSAILANPVVVIMLAPIALDMARRLNASPFLYLVSLAISSNVVTTVSMIADPPALILAVETGMRFFDFYWFQGRIGLGTLTIVGVGAAMATLLFQFRGMQGRVPPIEGEARVRTWVPFIVFIASAVALSLPFVPPWSVGVGVGVVALVLGRGEAREMVRGYDWASLSFLVGIFTIVGTVERVGLLADLASWFGSLEGVSPAVYLAVFVWASVAASSFIDNVPFTVLMIPVCAGVADALGVSPYPFYFGMLVGTGMGGNITPVGATANLLAGGMLERLGERVTLRRWLPIAVPFTLAAVGLSHLLLQLTWL